MDILDKVEKLISLANSPNENEANLAARRACKLIYKYELKLRAQQSKRAQLRIIHAGRSQKCAQCRQLVAAATSSVWDDVTDEVFHINCFLTSLRELDKDLGKTEMDVLHDLYSDFSYDEDF